MSASELCITTNASRIFFLSRIARPFIRKRKTSSTMIAAAVLAWNPTSGKIRPKEDLNRKHGRGFGDAARHVDDKGDHADHQQRRGFTECVRHADDGAGQDAGERQRQNVMEYRLLP